MPLPIAPHHLKTINFSKDIQFVFCNERSAQKAKQIKLSCLVQFQLHNRAYGRDQEHAGSTDTTQRMMAEPTI